MAAMIRRCSGVYRDFRVRHDVISVAVASVAIYIVPDFVEHGGGREPFGIFRWQPMNRLQSPEQVHRHFPYLHGMVMSTR